MRVSHLFHSQTNTIALAAILLSISTLVSRILGTIRNALLAWRFGAGEETDIYFAAFRIPDMLYGIFIMGGISVAFLPIFAEYMRKDDKEAWRFTSNVLNFLVLFLAFLALLVFLFAYPLVSLITPGFSQEQKELTSALTRLMLVSPILFGISAVFSGLLHYFRKFLTYSLAPILYNLGIIGGIVFLVPLFGIWGLALGVLAGAFLHVGIQIPAAIASGFSWQRVFDVWHPSMRKMIQLSFPRTIGAAGYYLNLLFITALASTISVGSITLFTYANDLQYFAIGVFGVSFAMAAFPEFSRFFVQNNREQLKKIFSRTVSQIIFFVLPTAVFLFLLRAQIIRLLYGTTLKFGWEATQLTAAALGIFAFGVVFHSLIPIGTRGFFAMQNTRTPAVASILAVGVNMAMSLLLLEVLADKNALQQALVSSLHLQGISDVRILALPLAFVLSGIFHLAILSLFLARDIQGFFQKDLIVSLWKTGIAAFIGGLATYAVLQFYGNIFSLRTYEQVLSQFMLASIGGIAGFGMVAFLLKSPEALALLKKVVPMPTKKK